MPPIRLLTENEVWTKICTCTRRKSLSKLRDGRVSDEAAVLIFNEFLKRRLYGDRGRTPRERAEAEAASHAKDGQQNLLENVSSAVEGVLNSYFASALGTAEEGGGSGGVVGEGSIPWSASVGEAPPPAVKKRDSPALSFRTESDLGATGKSDSDSAAAAAAIDDDELEALEGARSAGLASGEHTTTQSLYNLISRLVAKDYRTTPGGDLISKVTDQRYRGISLHKIAKWLTSANPKARAPRGHKKILRILKKHQVSPERIPNLRARKQMKTIGEESPFVLPGSVGGQHVFETPTGYKWDPLY